MILNDVLLSYTTGSWLPTS